MAFPKLVKVLSTALILIILPLSANAQTAHTTQDVNLRTGPGTEYERVATLAAGIRVEILKCQTSWCRVSGQGIRGWVSANYLDRAVVVKPIVVVRPIIIVRPHIGHRPLPRPRRPNCKIAPGIPCR